MHVSLVLEHIQQLRCIDQGCSGPRPTFEFPPISRLKDVVFKVGEQNGAEQQAVATPACCEVLQAAAKQKGLKRYIQVGWGGHVSAFD
jgi:hypothetical protein